MIFFLHNWIILKILLNPLFRNQVKMQNIIIACTKPAIILQELYAQTTLFSWLKMTT